VTPLTFFANLVPLLIYLLMSHYFIYMFFFTLQCTVIPKHMNTAHIPTPTPLEAMQEALPQEVTPIQVLADMTAAAAATAQTAKDMTAKKRKSHPAPCPSA